MKFNLETLKLLSVCIASSNELPISTSMVVLRVGARLQLRCTNRVLSWSKDGVSLVDGFKYSIDARMLTVRHTGMLENRTQWAGRVIRVNHPRKATIKFSIISHSQNG